MLVLNDQKVDYPNSVSWLEDPTRCPRATDFSPRRTWIHAVVMHTTEGKKGPLKEGGRDTGRDLALARYQAATSRQVSWDYTIDCDGSVAVSNDPVKNYTWHATSVNGITLGIEMVQDSDGGVYRQQIEAAARFVGFLCDRLGIQKQVPWRAGKAVEGIIQRIAGGDAGRDVVGVYGHRNQTANRGPGDPGNFIFEELVRIGFEPFDMESGEDLAVWKERQKALGLAPQDCDGVPGPGTLAALKAAGYRDGIWVNGKTSG